MISFIVIGKNESNFLFKCLSSINKTISHNQILKSEIIYIDSDSIDNSLEIAQSFKNISTFKIKGKTNAGLARNIGAEKTKGSVLCFIDGDMELIPKNFEKYFNNGKLIDGDYLTGDFYNYIYQNNILVSKNLYHDINKKCYKTLTGGIFFINRDLWFNNNGMRTCFRRSQDYNFSIRMAKSGKKVLYKPTPIVFHHTVEYNDLGRFNNDLFRGNFFYQVLLIKYNFFNKYIIPIIFRELTLLLFIPSFFIVFFLSKPIFLSLYIFSIFSKIFYKNRFKEIIKYMYIYLIIDLCGFLSLFFFWPRNIEKKDYQIFDSKHY